MADNYDSQERTEQATEKHLHDAREKGDVPRSQDLSAALVIAAVLGSIVALHTWLWGELEVVLETGLSYNFLEDHGNAALLRAFGSAGLVALKFLAVPAGAALLAALLAPAFIGGFAFSTEALVPKPGRLNPAEGFKRMVSLRSLVELAKSMLKFVLIGGVLAFALYQSRDLLLATSQNSVQTGIVGTLRILEHASLLFAVALVAIAAADALWQRFDYARRMRMTRQEQRDENKEAEGDPQVRNRVRRLQRQRAQRRMMQAVPTADAVVANPDHFAVALRYDEVTMQAPKVVAKGLDLLAIHIRGIAAEHNVPVVVAPALARALYHTTRVGQAIPSELYAAVAQILVYIYRVQSASEYEGETAAAPNPKVDPKLLGPYLFPEEGA